jgi:diadenosine tetraphosphate (Ap4A) HIT family hydrolase
MLIMACEVKKDLRHSANLDLSADARKPGARNPMILAAAPWSLHAQLEKDAVPVGDLPLSRVLAVNDANFPWLLLVPRRTGASEIIDLPEPEQARLMAEIAQVAGALKSITGCDKLNVAAIGNVVPQLHVHVIARRIGDAAWPKPVWGAVPARPYAAGELEPVIAALRGTLGFA